jgi:UDP-N-acetylmuramoyl-tripeptide--D-alanyl-D-alanine ligase
VLGRHNVYNALAAISCGIIFGIAAKEIKNKLFNFIMPLTRLNFREIKGYRIIDDTYNSNPLSLGYAIEALKELNTRGKKVFVMGDMLELGEESVMLHREIAKKIIDSGIDTLITVGPLSHHAADFIKSKKSNLKVYSCGCNLEARGILFNLLKNDDLVLVKGSRGMQMEKIIEDL